MAEGKENYGKILQETIDKVFAEVSADGWQDSGSVKAVRYAKKPGAVVNKFKSVVTVKAPLKLLVEWVENYDLAKKWDDALEVGRVVEEIEPNVRIEYLQYEAVWPTSARDFCIVTGFQERDGVSVLGMQSVVHEGAPEVKGKVRASIYGGFIFKPVADAADTFEVTYITEVDLKGSIPKAVVNKVNQNAPESLAKFQEMIEKAAKA